jgi:hypothetical protein
LKLLTTKYRVRAAQIFIDYVRQNNLYMFASSFLSFENDLIPPAPLDTVDEIDYRTHEEMIFAKKITASDIAHVVRNHRWIPGVVYDAYSNKEKDLDEKIFFVYTVEGSGYSIFKCLDNNNNAVSTQPPLLSQTSPSDELYKTADGYMWKLMYTVQESVFKKFSTSDFIPIIESQDVKNAAVDGTIENVRIEYPGSGYEVFANCIIDQINVTGNSRKFYIQGDGQILSPHTGQYVGSGMYMTSGAAAGQFKKILEYGFEGNNRYVILETPFSVLPSATDLFEIAPYVTVDGDGTGFLAKGRINPQTFSVDSIDVINRGQNYTFGNTIFSSNTNVIGGQTVEPVETSVVISPFGGHGSDQLNELYAQYSCTSIDFISTFFPTGDNEYRTFGIMDKPIYETLRIRVNSTTELTTGTIITQKDGAVSGLITNLDLIEKIVSLTSVSGVFETNIALDGKSTIVTAILDDVVNVDLRTALEVDLIFQTSFEKGERVTQETTGASGIVHEFIEGTPNKVKLVNVRGTFQVSSTFGLIGGTTGARAIINRITNPIIRKASGDILYKQNMLPVQRNNTQTERIKIIIGL